MKRRILIVDDDQGLSRVLSDNLAYCGFDVRCVANGDEALTHVRAYSPDLVLLDVMLPGTSGFQLCSLIRQGGRTPVVMLTARDQKSDKVKGLELGADDYITKPFDFEELQARIRAVLRRARLNVVSLELGDVTIDFAAHRATRSGRDIHLTRREFNLLSYLAERQNSVVDRSELLREVWGFPAEPKTRAVDYAIRRLRRKVEKDPHNPRFVHTVAAGPSQLDRSIQGLRSRQP
jgi:DNA-binding response OmpR family regulator